MRKFKRKLKEMCNMYNKTEIVYDNIYDFIEGWIAYAKHANTYNLRQKILTDFENKFSGEISTKEINRTRLKERRDNF